MSTLLCGCRPAADHAPPAPPQRSSDAVRAALTEVVENQLAAFRERDFVRARSFAAAALQRQVSDTTFAIMIQRGYPSLIDSTEASFGRATDNGTEAFLDVLISDDGGRREWYRYALLREKGGWRIAGVVALPDAGEGIEARDDDVFSLSRSAFVWCARWRRHA
ncbi:MAG: DUF4864 domain-containing protein [Opitutaceae bacterium]